MKILIIGCGRMGAGLARALALRDHSITVIDRDPASFAYLGPAFQGQTIVGVGFDRDVLLQAGIERADGLAAVTASDEANIVTARLANQVFRVPRVVARLYDPGKAEIYNRLGLQTISPVTWGIDRIADLLVYSPLDSLYSIGNGSIDLIEFEVPLPWVNRTVKEISIPGETVAAAVSRGTQTFIPGPGTVFQPGDLLHLVVLSSAVDRLKEMLGLS